MSLPGEPETEDRRRVLPVVVVVAALAVGVLTVPGIRGFVDAHSSIVVIAGAIGLSLAAWWGVRITSSVSAISRNALKLAEATWTLADANARREPPGPIPVVAFELVPEARVNRFTVSVTNVGTGPALGLAVELEDSPLRYRQEPPARTRALGPGTGFEITFLLEEDHPFRDPDHPRRWPRDDEDAAAIQDAVSPPRHEQSGVVEDPNRHMLRLEELQARYGAYRLQLLESIAREVTAAGTLTARYGDLVGRSRASRAEVSVAASDRPDRPGDPHLGALEVTSCPESTPRRSAVAT